MTQLLDPAWWFSFAGEVWPWWLACVVLGLIAWPLTVRVFHNLTDCGAGLSIGLGIMLTTWIAWVLAHPYSGRALAFRALYVAIGAALLFYGRRHRALGAAGALFMFVGAAHLPHGRASILLAAALVTALSAAVSWGPERHRSALRLSLVPFVVSQLLFAIGLLYFVNVRSYLPWATFDIGLSAAEKAGNLMHLNSALRAVAMPPGDAWFLGEPENYYYGGHLMVATLAKLTGTPAAIAFNLGLATIVALSLAMGFSLAYSMAVAPPPGRRDGFAWHRGMAWGLLGALAIAIFGNLDAWRQLGKRNPEDARRVVIARLGREAEHARDAASAAAAQEEIRRVEARSLERARWSTQNLKTVDFWKSSRAIHGAPATETNDGTITEFPYFSALLGDLHPHHMALPYTLAALAACLALLRATLANPVTTEAAWLAAGAPAAVAMGVLTGAVLPVNIWDSIVLAVLYLLVVWRSRQGVVADERWREAAFGSVAFTLSWILALVVNFSARVPVFGVPVLYLAALAIAIGGPLLGVPLLRARHRALLASAAVAALGGLIAGLRAPDGSLGLGLVGAVRDALLLGLSLAAADWLALRRKTALTRWVAALGAYAGVGAIGVVIALPFLLNFRSPLGAHLLERPLPPVPSASVVNGGGSLIARIWAASPINPFPAELRTELPDELAHWGLFALPLIGYLLFLLARGARKRPRTTVAWIGSTAAVGAVAFAALDGYWAGALALSFSAIALLLATSPRTAAEDVPPLLFTAAGFFWCWFVEALHFDDSYGGVLERYNTPFKIFYPVWPILAVAAVSALRRMSPPARVWSLPGWAVLRSPSFVITAAMAGLVGGYWLGPSEGLPAAGVGVATGLVLALLVHAFRRLTGRRPQSPVAPPPEPAVAPPPSVEVAPEAPPPVRRAPRGPYTEAPALAAAVVVCALGLLYPFAGTAVRTRSLFSEPIEGTYMDDPNGERTRDFYTRRTLNALSWLGQTKRFTNDLPAIEWLIENGQRGEVVLETPADGAYRPEGRVASMTGLPTLIGWSHHENQWRGWTDPIPPHLQRRFFDDLAELLPPLPPLPSLPRPTQLAIYRVSLDGMAALRDRLTAQMPGASADAVASAAQTVIDARQRAFSGTAFTEHLQARAAEIYRAPNLDQRVSDLLRLYRVRYVFVGSLEREHYGATLGKFQSLTRLYSNPGAVVYEVPESVRTAAVAP